MAGSTVKGTVIPLDSLFSPDEAQKAAKRVLDAISDRRRELDRLLTFIADNSDLTALVQKLPEDLSHNIMVPFGSAAFFPGRLIHTNEFLVLLGEGYYADRTAKQTTKILQRRGEALEAQIEALKATVLDLEAEARFFDSTAAEAAEGLVEIREDYIEEAQQNEPESGISESSSLGSNINNIDAEYAQIMARLDELEKEELEAESGSGGDEDEYVKTDYDHKVTESKTLMEDTPKNPVCKSKDQEIVNSTAAKPNGVGSQQHLIAQSSIVDFNKQFSSRDDSCKNDMEQFNTKQKLPLPVEPKENLHGFPVQKREAFTGSIVEHTHGLQSSRSTKIPNSDQSSSSSIPSKPVSRFKMQKSNR